MSTVTVSKGIKEPLTHEFDDLFRDHYAMVYRSAFSVTFNTEDAEDVVQTIFLRLLRNGLPTGVKNTRGYLYRAAVNEALNVVRSRRQTQDVDQRTFDRLPGLQRPAQESSMSARIAAAMAQLHPAAVEMLVLRLRAPL
jgi:RNA polymerase sigma factor (sigma-70 family)